MGQRDGSALMLLLGLGAALYLMLRKKAPLLPATVQYITRVREVYQLPPLQEIAKDGAVPYRERIAPTPRPRALLKQVRPLGVILGLPRGVTMTRFIRKPVIL